MTDSDLRLNYLLIQPVYIFDDGQEFRPGPPVQAISLQPSEVAAFIESLPEVKAGVLEQMAQAEAKRAADLAENLTPAQIEEAAEDVKVEKPLVKYTCPIDGCKVKVTEATVQKHLDSKHPGIEPLDQPMPEADA